MAEASASAEGSLARTPLAHLLVYALDRRLSGALFLTQPDGIEHVVRLARGVPVKVRLGDRFSLLGEMLIEADAIDAKTLEDALATKGLLGDVLLLAGRVDRDVLEKTAETQFVRRMVRLFGLEEETSYRYYDAHDELADYGGDPARVDPLALLWAGVREHGDASSMMEGTLAKLGDAPMRLAPSATVARFDLDAHEAKVLDMLAARSMTLDDLCAIELMPAEAVRRFAYALLITRQLDLGTEGVPLGADVPSAEGTTSSVPPAPTPVARMQLRSTVHRLGAAAPDLPGDGERGAPIVATLRRSRDRVAMTPVPDEPPPSQRVTTLPPDTLEPAPSPVSDTSLDATDPGTPIDDATTAPGLEAALPEADDDDEYTNDADTAITQAPDFDLFHDGEIVREPIATAPDAPPDPYAGMSASEIFWLATERFAHEDTHGAVDACDAGCRDAPNDPDLISLGAWARAQMGAADLKALAVQLDEVLGVHAEHVEARYYRAMLRKRLGDEAGSVRDLQHVIELAPGHAEAARELATVVAKHPSEDERPSLFGKLFKR